MELNDDLKACLDLQSRMNARAAAFPGSGASPYVKDLKGELRRVCDWLRSRGVRHIWLDSDGDIHSLIPIWLESGINGLWPFEVQAGMDVVEIRRTYRHELGIAGGIDKRCVAAGGDAMRREVDRVMPLVEDGGYFPELDHSAPPDISWAHMCEYTSYLLHRLGRG